MNELRKEVQSNVQCFPCTYSLYTNLNYSSKQLNYRAAMSFLTSGFLKQTCEQCRTSHLILDNKTKKHFSQNVELVL